METLKVLELFAGIGACSKALERLHIPFEIVDAVEIDKYAIKSFNAIHGTNFEPQDICKWNKDIKVDLIMHGSPCQDFSIAGLGAGGDEGSGTRSSLLYESVRIIEKLQPKYVIWENVKNMLSKKHRQNWYAYAKKLEDLGYINYCAVLNAKNYGIPQNRDRVFTVSIKKPILKSFQFPSPFPLTMRLKDMLEDKVDEKYYLSNQQVEGFLHTTAKAKAKGNGFEFKPLKLEENDFAHTIATKPGSRQTDNFIDESDNLPSVIGGIGEKDSNGGRQWKLQNRVYDNKIATSVTGSFRPYYKEEGLNIKNANKLGYDVAKDGDSVNLGYPSSKTRRGRVGHNISNAVTTGALIGVVEYKTKNHRIIETAEKSNFRNGETAYLDVYNRKPRTDVTSTINAGTDLHQNNIVAHNYRIRKLTPKECWRLMGFDDEDFEKASKVNSQTQLYKQAGNSIVVNVLQLILKELLK